MIEATFARVRRIHAAVDLGVLMGALWFRLRLDAWRRKPTWCERAPGCPVHGAEA